MSGAFRTTATGAIDRSRLLHFTFDGRAMTGHPGDTVASALLANGVHLVGRSFKYHRPRGILGIGVEEPNALVGVTRGPGRFEPNARATCVELVDGLSIESQNRSPSLAFDIGAMNDFISPLIPAGFYYKTFMWPRGFWAKVYEPAIRRTAGLGQPPSLADPDRYGQRFHHCETLIVGAGPAGLAAALAASAVPGRVTLVDENSTAGGQLRDESGIEIEGMSAGAWIEHALATLEDRGVKILLRTTAFGYGIDNMVALAQRCDDTGASGTRERHWLVRAGRVVLATGAIERPLVFPNNDRPGIMLASAGRGYLKRFGVLVGRRVVVVGQHDSGWRAAFDLAAAGADVKIVDARASVAEDLMERARASGIEVLLEEIPVGSRGRRRVTALAVASSAHARPRWLRCDAVLMAGGWTPSVHLHSQSGGRVGWDGAAGAFVPTETRQNQASAGASRGSFATDLCLGDGWTAGGGAGHPPATRDRRDGGRGSEGPLALSEGANSKAFVDFQNDVTARDLRLAVREGFRSVEHMKRYTTNGMATDQGRTSNINALAIAAHAQDVTIATAGLTTFRAPYTPVTFGTLAGYARGPLFEPIRTTPLHDRAVALGALFENVGQWRRARCLPRGTEDDATAVLRECRAVREAAGLFDASTLGKIEVVGPDAGRFLDFMYAGRLSTLPLQRCRYAVMLGEDGFIIDDGIISRLADDRFHVTTTTGGAATVLATMEDFRQTELPHLRVWLTSTTEQWAVIAVNGPHARRILEPLVAGIDLSPDAMPHMSVREGAIAGVRARIFRASFTGELGYEVNVPAGDAVHVWDAIFASGAPFGATAYGTDASHVLRAEKGYIIIGQETDGTVAPDDVGLGRLVAMSKPDFVGKRSLERECFRRSGRRQLVALLTPGRERLEEGSQVVALDEPGAAALGYVSSAYVSAALERPFALAMIRDGRSRIGSRLAVATDGAAVPVEVVDAALYDPDGERLHG